MQTSADVQIRFLVTMSDVSGAGIKASTDFFRRSKDGHDLLRYMQRGSSFRVTTDPSRPHFDAECTKASQFYSLAASHSSDDLIKDGVDEPISIPHVKVRILCGNARNQI